MTLLKTSFWTGLATLIRLISGFVVVKVLAIYVGPVGFAIIGQFQNFVTMVLTFSGNMIQTGVVKYTAEFRDDNIEKAKILSTALWICVLSSLGVALIIFFMRHSFAVLILKDIHLSWVLTVFAVTLIFYGLNAFLLAILNGEQKIKRLTVANMGTSILSLVFTCILTRYYSLTGALIALVLSQSIVFFFTLSLVLKSKWFCWKNFSQKVSKKYLYNLFKYALMAVTTALVLPTSQLLIREYIIHVLSWQDAGYWQAVTRVSDAYLLLITTTISVYYLPKISSLHSMSAIKQEMVKAAKFIMPVAFLLAFLVFNIRNFVTILLFTRDFIPMEPLFLFQLMGDVFKIAVFLLTYVMLAKGLTKLFIFTEIFFCSLYVLLVIPLVKLYGLGGVTLAFFMTYFIAFIILSYWFWFFQRNIT